MRGDWPWIAVHEGRERIFGEFITGNRVWGCTPGQCIDGESPRGGGADGEGAERPFPCLDVSLKTSLAGITPASRPLRGLLPPPQGGGQSLAIVRIPCTGGKRILTRINRDTVVDALPGSVSMGNRPRGEGLTGRGEAETTPPSPVSCVSTGDVFPRRGGEHLPCPVLRPVSTSIPHEEGREEAFSHK